MPSARIIHVDFCKGGVPVIAGAPTCLIVFWWHDCPVAQIEDWGPPDREIDLPKLRETAVAPDILERASSIVAREVSLAEAAGDGATVAICTRDRPLELKRCLASLSRQTRAPAEVIVVDNGSADERTREVATAAGVRYVREDRRGLDIARNTAARLATGAIIAYTDDDVELQERWLERLVRAFERPEIVAVTGLVLPVELETEAQRHFETHWGFGRGYRPIDFGPAFYAADRKTGCPSWEIGAGASMAFRREIFAKIGFFDERLDVGAAGCSGDSEFWHRILTRGLTCRYEPSAVAFHHHRRCADALSRQIFHYMRGHAAALLVQFERSRNLGNLRRAFLTMPSFYFQRLARRFIAGPTERDRYLRQEIAGFASGLLFYARQRSSAAR